LVQAVVTNFLRQRADEVKNTIIGSALGDIMVNAAGSTRDVVADELEKQIAMLVASPEREKHVTGLSLATEASMAPHLSRHSVSMRVSRDVHQFWNSFSRNQILLYKEYIKALAATGSSFGYRAVHVGGLTIGEWLTSCGRGISPLFKPGMSVFGGVMYADMASSLLEHVMSVRPDLVDTEWWQLTSKSLEEITEYVESLPPPPWFVGPETESRYWHFGAPEERIETNVVQLNERQLFACGVLVCCIAERSHDPRMLRPLELRTPMQTFEPFVRSRLSNAVDTEAITNSTVPHRELFEAWAHGDLYLTK
jgi:hypothetical protein